MRLVIREYISFMKEDKELDALISELLKSIKIIPLVKPEKGRQYGVDLSAVGIDQDDEQKRRKIFLFVVKQGDLTRTTWNTGLNAVKPSIEEVCDTYIPTQIPERYSNLPIKVIVATNGDKKQTVNIDWVQYTKKRTLTENIEFDFWGIDKITQLVDEHMFSETLFSSKHSKLLRLTLAFLELNEYDLRHFYTLIDELLEEGTTKRSDKRRLSQLNLCLNILWGWAKDMNNLKPALKASEYVLLKSWKWLEKKDFVNDKRIVASFTKIKDTYLEVGRDYFIKIQNHCHIKHGLFKSTHNFIDYTLLVWEQIGMIATVGLLQVYETAIDYILNKEVTKYADARFGNACVVADSLYDMIDNNPPALNPCYDEHCIEINLALLLFYKTGRKEQAKMWIKKLIAMTGNAHIVSGNLPLFYTSESRLIEAHFGTNKEDSNSSILLTVLSEWCVIFEIEEDYQVLKEILSRTFPDMDLQMWYPENETNDIMFSENALRDSGSTQSMIKLPDTIKEYKEVLLNEIELFGIEKEFPCYKYGLYFLPYLAARHFRTYLLPYSWRNLLVMNNLLAKDDQTNDELRSSE